jgi:hypothetical protein
MPGFGPDGYGLMAIPVRIDSNGFGPVLYLCADCIVSAPEMDAEWERDEESHA